MTAPVSVCMSTETESFFHQYFLTFSTVSRPTLGIRLYFITTILTVYTARTLRVFEILNPHRALSTRTCVKFSDGCRWLLAGWLLLLKAF